MTPSPTIPRHHHPERSKHLMALLALLLSTLLLMLAARISHTQSGESSESWPTAVAGA